MRKQETRQIMLKNVNNSSNFFIFSYLIYKY